MNEVLRNTALRPCTLNLKHLNSDILHVKLCVCAHGHYSRGINPGFSSDSQKSVKNYFSKSLQSNITNVHMNKTVLI